MRRGLQSGSLSAWIFVVRPPRERPIACSCSPVFPPLAERCALIEVESIDKVTLYLPQLAKALKMAPSARVWTSD